MKVEQIDTTKLEKQIFEPWGTDVEKTARTIFWLRLANFIAMAQEEILADLKDRRK